MKTLTKLFLSAIVILNFSSCGNDGKKNQNRESDSLRTVISNLNESMNELVSSLDTIAENLDKIAAKQQVLYYFNAEKGDLKATTKQRLNSAISDINEMMNKNKKKLDALNEKMKTSFSNSIFMGKIITIMNNQLSQKTTELDSMNKKLKLQNAQLEKLQTDLFVLTVSTDVYTEIAEDDEKALHTAYYITGKTKYLEDINLIDRKGGLLGMGKTDKLSSNFDDTKFIKIDYNKTKSIPINNKKYKIITSHPTDTYSLKFSDQDKNYLLSIEITNPEKFWRASKYLVVSIN